MPPNEYITLGRSGLRVSSLCLGTMTFGTEWGWGAEESAPVSLHPYVFFEPFIQQMIHGNAKVHAWSPWGTDGQSSPTTGSVAKEQLSK